MLQRPLPLAAEQHDALAKLQRGALQYGAARLSHSQPRSQYRCGRGMSPVPAPMWFRGEPSPGADVAAAEPSPSADVGGG
jgi:hypothetical protein